LLLRDSDPEAYIVSCKSRPLASALRIGRQVVLIYNIYKLQSSERRVNLPLIDAVRRQNIENWVLQQVQNTADRRYPISYVETQPRFT